MADCVAVFSLDRTDTVPVDVRVCARDVISEAEAGTGIIKVSMFRAVTMAVDYSILLLAYSISIGALGSPDLLLH